MKWLIAIGLASLVLIGASKAVIPTTNQPALGRMVRARLTANSVVYADPQFRNWVNNYAVIDVPVLPDALAITEIVKTDDTMCDSIYIEINGQFVGAIHTNNIFIFGNSSIGRHDAFNFKINNPIFIPPGAVVKLYTPWVQGLTLMPSFYFTGYQLNPGEY